MAKRRLSSYNLHMKKRMRAGASFLSAVRSWRGGRKKVTNVSGGDTMARRRGRKSVRARSFGGRRGRSGRRSGGFGGIGGIPNTVMRAGEAYAVGAGTKMMLDGLSNISGFTMLKPYTGYIGAFMAYKKGGGLPGIVSAVPLALSQSSGGSSNSGNVTVL